MHGPLGTLPGSATEFALRQYLRVHFKNVINSSMVKFTLSSDFSLCQSSFGVQFETVVDGLGGQN